MFKTAQPQANNRPWICSSVISSQARRRPRSRVPYQDSTSLTSEAQLSSGALRMANTQTKKGGHWGKFSIECEIELN